jgi:hypothetical protein
VDSPQAAEGSQLAGLHSPAEPGNLAEGGSLAEPGSLAGAGSLLPGSLRSNSNKQAMQYTGVSNACFQPLTEDDQDQNHYRQRDLFSRDCKLRRASGLLLQTIGWNTPVWIICTAGAWPGPA